MAKPLDDTDLSVSCVLSTARIRDESSSAQLIVLSGPMVGRRVIVEDGVTIGRDPRADLVLEGEPTVSRFHARITRVPSGDWLLVDLRSTNGISVNGGRVDRAILSFGDKVRLGSGTVLLFARHDSLEDQLFAAQRFQILGQLAAGVAHDFNNILAAILANADDSEGIAPDELRARFDGIRSAVSRGASLAKQLLSISATRTQSGDAAALSTVMGEVRRLLERTVPENVEIRVELETDLHVACSPTALFQLLMNLGVNAAKALPAGGTVTIRGGRVRSDGSRVPLREDCEYAAISVEDDGVGMSEEDQRRIFEPFFTTRSQTDGTGLGLATVARITAEHSGRVAVKSALGVGSRFDVYLPTTDQSGSSASAPPLPPKPGPAPGAVP